MKEYVIGDPYCEELELTATDNYLIVACDGLWDVASDQEVADAVMAPVEEGAVKTAQVLANKLLIKALKQGSTDNVSIIVIAL
jgi:protein phosphatase PTC1